MLSQAQFDSARAAIIVADLMPDEPPKGRIFKLHALSSTQRLSKVRITVPTPLQKGAWDAFPPDQQLSLAPIGDVVGQYYLNRMGRKKGFARVAFVDIPVVFDASYSVEGVMASRRALYSLATEIVILDDDTKLPSVEFKDFAFVQGLSFDTNPQQVVDDIFAQNKPSNH
jgi:hypothetical protein